MKTVIRATRTLHGRARVEDVISLPNLRAEGVTHGKCGEGACDATILRVEAPHKCVGLCSSKTGLKESSGRPTFLMASVHRVPINRAWRGRRNFNTSIVQLQL